MIFQEPLDADSQYWEVFMDAVRRANKGKFRSDTILQIATDRVLWMKWDGSWAGKLYRTELPGEEYIQEAEEGKG